ncbi:MAG: hypothetical protein HY315_04085 [Acidobacteria bacterium]|nr:hypothetical protein [Acidobacteriota bacterium]
MKRGTIVYLALALFAAFTILALAEGPPKAGTDTFDSIAELEVSIFNGPMTMIGVVGPTQIQRGQPKGGAIDTEMLALDLRGGLVDPNFGPLQVQVRESPTRASRGQIMSPKGDGFFPAESFFDVFVEIELTPEVQTTGPTGPTGPTTSLMLHNEQPIRMMATIHSIPPIENAYNSPANQTTVLLDRFGNRVGVIRHVQHVPAQPSHAKIKRELINVELMLKKLLRAHGLP